MAAQPRPAGDGRPPLQPADGQPGRVAVDDSRIDYLDWLRALAILGVFLYHSLQPFSMQDWHVKNDQLSPAVDGVISFIDPWGVAFFFLIAGASSYLALGRRSAGQYASERLMRLLVPLTVAYLLLSPVQAFIEETFRGRYAGPFLAGVPLFFQDVASRLPLTLFHPLLVDRTYHLWFVVFLLWFSFLGLPVFIWLRRPAGRRLLSWLGERAGRRGATLLIGLPVMFLPLLVLPLAPESEDWGTFVYLLGFFIAGYVLMSDPRLREAVRRDILLALGVAAAADVAILLTGVPQFLEAWSAAPDYSVRYAWSYLLIGVQAWAWVNVAFGLGMRFAPFQRPLPRVISAAAMPFFLVHQPVILAVAFFVVRWNAGIPPKWVAIAVVSFVCSAALAIAISRLPVVSMMFGVKRRMLAPSTARPLHLRARASETRVR